MKKNLPQKMNIMNKFFYYTALFILLASCTNPTVSTKNEYAGKLTATHQLVVSGEKKIHLDYETAPKPTYMQMVEDTSGVRMLTFLNTHKNAIYFYDYESSEYISNIGFEREGPNALLSIEGYYVKNMDSIYVYDRPVTEVALTDRAGHVKQKVSLRGQFADAENKRDPQWAYYYPQYLFRTVAPFIEIDGKLLLTGFFPFSIPDSIINNFRFMASLEMKTNRVEYKNLYPKELYGSNINWDEPVFMQGFPELSPNGELIFSFPVTHHLYIANLGAEGYRKVYAGSNVAGTIHSIDHEQKGTPEEVVIAHYLQQDIYTAIRYDPWRKVYYRFLLQGVPSADFRTPAGKKPIIVIVMDEQFNYLGETLIGTGEEWNWTNSFVTKEGLNIEYVYPTDTEDIDEEYLNFKIFTIEKL
jgi:hypothetical protein